MNIAEQNFRDEMAALVKHEYNDDRVLIGRKVKPNLDRELRAGIEPYTWGGVARNLIIETAYNLIDAGLNGGAVNAWEFREAIEHDGANEHAEAVKDNDTGAELAGQMYRHGWVSPSHDRNGVESMVDGFTDDLADEIAGVLHEIAETIEDECRGAAELDEGE